MAELKRRYRFLIESAGTPVAILVDNLDRCRADYVVELLEGVQTLLKQADPTRDLPLVVYLVAADRAWLCDSYLQTYEEFAETTQQVGRPFGLAFLDKIFDLSLTIPKVSAAASRDFKGGDIEQLSAAASILTARRELEVRQCLDQAERRGVGELSRGDAPPVQQGLRLCAARRLAQLESDSDTKACADTEDDLKYLAERIDPGAEVVRQLAAAYCVQRITQLLAGHAIDSDPAAIRRLGLWTILVLRWPLIAEHLRRHPGHLENLRRMVVPGGVDESLRSAFERAEFRDFAELAAEIELDKAAIQRFSVPVTRVSAEASSEPEPAGAQPPVTVTA